MWGCMGTVKKYSEKFTQNFDVILSFIGIGLGLLIVSLYYLVKLNQKDIV